MTVQTRHTIVKHEPGRRLVVVEDGSGKLIEIVRSAANSGADLTRRENGVALPAPLYSGPVDEVSAILDGMAASYAAGPANPDSASSYPLRRQLLSAAALVAVIVGLGGIAMYDRAIDGDTWHVSLRPSNDPVRSFGMANTIVPVPAPGIASAQAVTTTVAPPDASALAMSTPAAAPEGVSTLPTTIDSPPPAVIVGTRPTTPAPQVTLPVPSDGPVPLTPAQAAALPHAPVRGEALGLAKIEYAPLTKPASDKPAPASVTVAGKTPEPAPVTAAGIVGAKPADAQGPEINDLVEATDAVDRNVIADAKRDAAPAAALPPVIDTRNPAKAAVLTPDPAKAAAKPEATTVVAGKSEAAKPAPVAPASTVATLATKGEAANQQSAVTQAEARKDLGERGTAATQQEMEKLQAVLQSLERGEKIPLEVVRKLPHEIAQRLRESGVVLTDEEAAIASKAEGAPGYRIVRLSSDAIDRLRDKDGIPTVPQANSWASTGGNVRLPLPGGGEIKSADDMLQAFHLQP